ncbi:class I SAM-dependent methyltransferase [Jiangella alkaliphila]|uniref:Methyltransferase domain-containing protein n=1 Tax=Jiangella alkaliphila TaxID=419479 RepID=A0A1H2LCI4_9ACTN|nr:class I SAM-dependent methyltransferase [Jiangella alkaliphila]SDU78639.1 Methyltransferase domain-containing protein [Jiangella alkaliphila]
MSPGLGADEYQRSAEYVDILLAEPWRVFGPLVAAGLQGVNPAAGPVVDLGAGTGRGVLAVAAALPEAEVLAVEPSPAMRAVLMARVGSDDDLRRRVSVVAGDLASVRSAERFGAVLAMNMIGHLDRAARKAFWATLAGRLASGAPALVNLQPPAEAVEVAETPGSEVTVGRYTYRGSGRAIPTAADQVTWHMTYRTFEDGVMVAEERVSYAWWVLSEDGLRAEVAAAGLHAVPLGSPEMGLHRVETVV